MIDDLTAELASLYVFELLEPGEERAFTARLAAEPELRAYVDALLATAAGLAHTAAPRPLPPALEARILSGVGALPGRPTSPARAGSRLALWSGWALAAGLAVLLALTRQWAGQERDRAATEATAQEAKLGEMTEQVAALEKRDALSQVRIASLTSKLAEAPDASAVVVWDEQKQRGVLKLNKLPQPTDGREYQLWVVDPQYPTPVNGGTFTTDRPGTARILFGTDRPITAAKAFAISLEPKGGVPVATGPIVLVGE